MDRLCSFEVLTLLWVELIRARDALCVLQVYSVFIMLWCTLFLEAWKRRENRLKHDWGTEQAEEEEGARPQFLSSSLVDIKIMPWGEAIKVLPPKQRCLRGFISLLTIVGLCLCVGFVGESLAIHRRP